MFASAGTGRKTPKKSRALYTKALTRRYARWRTTVVTKYAHVSARMTSVIVPMVAWKKDTKAIWRIANKTPTTGNT